MNGDLLTGLSILVLCLGYGLVMHRIDKVVRRIRTIEKAYDGVLMTMATLILVRDQFPADQADLVERDTALIMAAVSRHKHQMNLETFFAKGTSVGRAVGGKEVEVVGIESLDGSKLVLEKDEPFDV